MRKILRQAILRQTRLMESKRVVITRFISTASPSLYDGVLQNLFSLRKSMSQLHPKANAYLNIFDLKPTGYLMTSFLPQHVFRQYVLKVGHDLVRKRS